MMSEITYKIGSAEIKPEFELYNDIKLEFPSEQDVSVKEEVDDDIYGLCTQSNSFINAQLVQDKIKSEEIIDDDCVIFNTDILLYIEDSTSLKKFYCYQCNYAANDKKNLSKHIFAHRLKCNQCGYTTPDDDALMNHKQIHLLIGSLQCNICDYSCIESRSLDDHMSTHIDAELDMNERRQAMCAFECHKCGYQTNSEIILRFHETTHKNTVCSFDATSAEKINSKRSPLKLQKKKHCVLRSKGDTRIELEEKPYKCNLCDFSSVYANSLRGHMIHHSVEYRFKCDKCDYKTFLKQRLTAHKKVHTKKEILKCDVCKFSTKYITSLRFHMMKHSEKQMFICNKCDYKTFTKYRLASHKRSHSEKKSFQCNLCDFSFKYSKTLKLHMMIHYEKYLSGAKSATKKLISNTNT